MKHTPNTAFARSETVSEAGPDKWQILDLVTEAAPQIGISHRTIGVLRALLSFLPSREIAIARPSIVFPANATLSDRLHGMPESTLRRHLATLVKVGLVSRHDSPNRKRYARRRAGVIALAFGFDLAPLAQRYKEIQRLAAQETARTEYMKVKRDEILILRHQLQATSSGAHLALLKHVHLVLRRTPNEAVYDEVKAALIDALDHSAKTATPVKMSATTNKNERHIEPQSKHKFNHCAEEYEQITLSNVLEVCSELECYFPGRIATWRDLVRVTYDAAPMLRINPNVVRLCEQEAGPEHTAILIACVLQNAAHLPNPSAYMTRLLAECPREISASARALSAVGSGLSADNG